MVFQSPMRLERKSMAEDIAKELRRRILAGELAEGMQLSQASLAEDFGVSKVPVREALILLESEGFVSQNFHRGAMVAHSSPKQMMELFELRAHIEIWLLNMAMPLAQKSDVQTARKFAALFDHAENPVAAWEYNWHFHEALYMPADRPHIMNFLKKLHDQTGRYVILQYELAVDKGKGSDEHKKLTDFYEKKDKRAAKLLHDHILVAAARLVRDMQKKEVPAAPRLVKQKADPRFRE